MSNEWLFLLVSILPKDILALSLDTTRISSFPAQKSEVVSAHSVTTNMKKAGKKNMTSIVIN